MKLIGTLIPSSLYRSHFPNWIVLSSTVRRNNFEPRFDMNREIDRIFIDRRKYLMKMSTILSKKEGKISSKKIISYLRRKKIKKHQFLICWQIITFIFIWILSKRTKNAHSEIFLFTFCTLFSQHIIKTAQCAHFVLFL